MKKALLFILLIFCISASYSQTKLKPLPLSSIFIGDSTFSFEDTSVWAPRVQKHFMLGWQWQGPNANTNKRLHCNFYHDHFGGSGTRAIHMGLIPDSGAVKYLAWQHLHVIGAMQPIVPIFFTHNQKIKLRYPFYNLHNFLFTIVVDAWSVGIINIS